MQQQQRSRRVVMATMLMMVLADVFSGGLARAAERDYTNLTDILYARRHLLRTDDLVIAYGWTTVNKIGSSHRNLLLTSNSQITYDTATSSDECGYLTSTTVTAARMFDTPYDVAVSARFTDEGPCSSNPQEDPQLVWSMDGGLGLLGHPDHLSSGAVPFPGGTDLTAAAADITGHGYDDIAFATVGDTGLGIMVATAVDRMDPRQGLRFGPAFGGLDEFPSAMAAGTPLNRAQVFVVGSKGECDCGLRLESLAVDPQSLTLNSLGTFDLDLGDDNSSVAQAQIALGRFGNTTHDQLMVAYAAQGGTVKVVPIDFDDQGNPIQKPAFDTGQPVREGRFWMRHGQFDWGSAFDQAALLISTDQESSLRILTFGGTLNVNSGPVTAVSTGNQCVGDLAVGNFDRPADRPASRNPNLQLAAFLQPQCGGSNLAVQIWDVNPANDPSGGFQVQLQSVYSLSSQSAAGVAPQSMSMAAVDLQGRSYRLGGGTKITIEDYTQPTAITAMPPMHVDFVTPNGGGTAPTVLNLSALPDSFNTKYAIDSVNQTDTTTTNAVSKSFGFKETLGASFEVGNYKEGEGTKFKDTVTATQDIVNSTEAVQGKFESQGERVAITTGWGDSVSYTSSTFNIWVYEVLGQKVCPAGGDPNCEEKDKRPLTVQFSAPSETQAFVESGPLLEWYQPPWEPGNVFSYPANYAQLQQIVQGDIDKLTADHTYYTDSLSAVEGTEWRSGVNSSTTLGTSKTYSGDNNFSVAGQGGISDLFTVGFEVGFEAYGSNAFTNNTQTTNAANQSTGMTLNKPGTFAEQTLYAYAFTPYIFGIKQPVNFVDNVDLNTQVKTFGPLRSAFVADPTAPQAGGWWSRAYTVPDVALNHPARWTVTQAELQGPGTPTPANCLTFGSGSSKMDCMTLNQTTPDDPWSSAVHYMRGFFISSALKPGAGPQREMAVEGESLSLQARVYNYSLTPMPDDTKVHVRFYGVPWDQRTNMPAGNAFLIGNEDVVLGPIPAFDSSRNTPNWMLASTTWDTSTQGDKYFTFFVLTWMQKGDMLGAEMPGHGINGIPGPLTSFSDAAKLEEIVSGQTASYSNNLGFYKHALYVQSQRSTELAALTRNTPADVRLGQIKFSKQTVESGQSVEISALLQTGNKSASGVSVVFYDGDPQHGGKVFDVERIAYIRANDAAQARVLFRSNVCDEHRIYITVGKGKPYEVTDSAQPFKVQCELPKR